MSIANILLTKITEGTTLNELMMATNLSFKKLCYHLYLLKAWGYNIKYDYLSNGEIKCSLTNELYENKRNTLYMVNNEKSLKLIFLSDLHLTSVAERLDLLNEVYDFMEKANIHIIINGGDILDGFVGSGNRMFATGIEQIKYLINNHPFNQKIFSFICLGDHDRSILKKSNIDIINALKTFRLDLVPLGYNNAKIKIYNDEVTIRHLSNDKEMTDGLILSGHSHCFRMTNTPDHIHIVLPTISDISVNNFSYPGFIKATLDFKDGLIVRGLFEQFIAREKIEKVNEIASQMERKLKK